LEQQRTSRDLPALQRDCTAFIKTNDMERVLADIDADYGNRSAEILRHGVLLVFGAPCHLRSLAGQQHGRTIPLADMHPYFGRPISRMSNTGQSGADLPEHWATVLASSRSSFFRSLSLARMSSR
jgi:hypothetical protein